ncbi:MAG TPA: hypothetical protein VES95_08170 [Dermatophilaceae bacterium]|nr:hypothetical protein [Dermatophilaceae bacterium]
MAPWRRGGGGGRASCGLKCDRHPEHVYICCYGKPTLVGDRDHLAGESERDYPITHYVGWTRSQPPVRRLWTHGARSAHFVADLRPGTLREEELAKELQACPGCGGSLWYFGESPQPASRFQVGDRVRVGGRGRSVYLVAASGRDGSRRVALVATTPPAAGSRETARIRYAEPARLVLVERDTRSYLAQWERVQRLLVDPHRDAAALHAAQAAAARSHIADLVFD